MHYFQFTGGTNGTQVIHRCKETAELLALVIFLKGVNGFMVSEHTINAMLLMKKV